MYDVNVLALEAFLPKTMFEREKMMVANNLVAHCFISFLPNILFFPKGSNFTQRVCPNDFSIV